MSDRHAVLTLSCADAPGIVHAVSELLVRHSTTIVESQQFGDPISGRFFMRTEFAHVVDDSPLDYARINSDMEQIAGRFGMVWRMVNPSTRQRVVLMVSKLGHCLNDLLFRNSVGELHLDIVAVVSNHLDLLPLAHSHGVQFMHIPVTPETKPAAEEALLALVQEQQVDLVVLARYMQILSDDFCKRLEGRAINIHHSMLPSFKGARPYHQAHARGVKFVGATAHYVTADLDEGPIIEQQLVRVDHSLSPAQLTARGRDAETQALARAVRWHTENRIALNDGRTVVLR
ncbi:formyltetrahydrofolate deformylase [Streptomyces sp. NPDC006872]|uniref:formyltetrahydrofolate deformylase n=1 Tax=Streptomyces sp. NPDC006872 TaxID=3155720 RepID=UPI0033D6B551